MPVYQYAGTHDEIIDSRAVEKEFAPYAQNFEVSFVDGGGHCLFWENEDEAARVLAEFVKRVKGTQSV